MTYQEFAQGRTHMYHMVSASHKRRLASLGAALVRGQMKDQVRHLIMRRSIDLWDWKHRTQEDGRHRSCKLGSDGPNIYLYAFQSISPFRHLDVFRSCLSQVLQLLSILHK